MSLLDKRKRERSVSRRIYGRRRRRGFFAFCIAAVLALASLWGFPPYLEGYGLRASSEPSEVARVDTPKVAEAPEAVAEPKPVIVPVPDIPYNATEKEAEEMLERNGLKLGDVKREPNDEYEKGGVFYQDPLPGIKVKEGSRVGITLSSGPEKKDADGEAPEPATNDLYLTVPKLGLYDNTVYNSADPAALDLGAAKIPSTGFPWQDNANTYIAGHRIGYAGTESYNQFYNLPSMQPGDEIILEDANGTAYTYHVTDVFAVTPQESWVTHPEPGRDMITLQTCVASVDDWWTITPGLLSSPPGPETARLIVQADRVDIEQT